MVKKGDVVTVRAIVETSYDMLDVFSTHKLEHEPFGAGSVPQCEVKCLYRVEAEPWVGLVVGKSYLATGIRKEDCNGLPYLSEDKRHWVYKVVPMWCERFIEPKCVLEADIKVVQSLPSKALTHLRVALDDGA